MKKILVTGAAGFIGSNFVFHMLGAHPDYKIVCVDKLTYAGNLSTLAKLLDPTSKEYNDVAALVARIEHFCVGVNTRIYDKKTVYSLAHGYFDGKKLKSRILPVIDRKNNNMEYDYYSNTHQVLAWMDKVTEKQRKKP